MGPRLSARRISDIIKTNDTIYNSFLGLKRLFDSTLIKTKYCIPRANPSVISRGCLLEKLDHVPQRALTLVVAPMGYGKTTAVYEWVEKSGLQAAWLSLDESDNDPVVFWKYICAAMEEILPGISNHVEYAFSSHQLLEANVHINILIDRLAQHGGKTVLVIDDLHTISSAQILKGLSHLLAYLPANAHVIIVSRTEPAMELNQFELRSQVLRVTVADLRFRQDEIAAFYLKRDCAFGKEVIEKIGSYTEGWAAAMVAIAVSAQNNCVNKDLLNGITTTDVDIYQYLMNEVFKSYSLEKRAFLLRISILEFLQEDICGAVTGEDNVTRFFEDMGRRNEFLTLLGEERGAYRLHPILKDFLQNKLKQTDPDAFVELHAKAALWYRGQGMLPLAVSHYLSGMRYAEALELIEMQLGNFASKNEYETAHFWIEQLPEYYKRKSVKIAVFYSMYDAQNQSFEASRGWLARAKEMLQNDQRGEIGIQERVLVDLTAVNLLLREGNVKGLLRLIKSNEIRDSEPFRAIEYVDLNDSDIYIYRSPIHVMAKLFETDRDALYKLRDYHNIMSTKNPGFIPLSAGEYFYEKNRPEEALPLFLNAIEAAQAANCPGVLVPAMAGISRMKRSQADMAGALSVLDECENWLKTIQKPHWNDLVCALKTRYSVESGDMDPTERWLQTNKLHIFSEITRLREFELIVLARVLWAKSNTSDAEILLLRLLSFTETECRLHSQVEILNLLAMIACQKGNTRLAVEYLEKSLRIGLVEGYVRSFIDEQAPMLIVLRLAARSFKKTEGVSQKLKSFADSLVSLIQEEINMLPDSSTIGSLRLKKVLTEKEFEVLGLLCAAYSNEDIGKALNIGQRTVKAHTGSIYSKLGVKTRAQCVRLVYEESFTVSNS